MILVGGHDREVIAWASKVLNKHFVEPAAAFGIIDNDGHLKGAAIFNDFYAGGNLEFTYIGPGTVTRRIIRQIASYAFIDNKAARLTAKTARGNIVARKLLPRLGFMLEGTQRRYFGPRKSEDALVFVMHRAALPEWIGV